MFINIQNLSMKTLIIIVCIILLIYCLFKKGENFKNEGNMHEPIVAIASMMKNPKEIEYWLQYHIEKGINYFYIRLEDTPELHDYLKNHPNVTLEIGSSKDPIKTRVTYDTQIERQRDYMNRAIEWSKNQGIDWLIHIDCDELVDCNGSIPSQLANEIQQYDNVGRIIMENYEAQYDKINQPSYSCFISKNFIRCSLGGCTSYANGKSIGRVSSALRESGPHRFETVDNSKEIVSKLLRILHFESCDFKQYIAKFLRLASTETLVYPFPFYNDSINVARSQQCQHDKNGSACTKQFKNIYSKYKLKK
jgi:hypothetical protein